MATVWVAFVLTAFLLLGLAVVGLSWRGAHSQVFQRVGQHLLLLALITGLYPIGLWVMAPPTWAGAYVAIVAVLASIMAVVAVREARRSER